MIEELAMKRLVDQYDKSFAHLYTARINAPPVIAGIYFLFKRDEIVYVGQSVNIYARLSAHEKTKDFDCFSFIGCPPEHFNYLEAHFIVKFRPRLNGKVPKNPLYKSTDTIKKIFGMDKRKLKKLFRKYGIKPLVTEVNMYSVPEIADAIERERQENGE